MKQGRIQDHCLKFDIYNIYRYILHSDPNYLLDEQKTFYETIIKTGTLHFYNSCNKKNVLLLKDCIMARLRTILFMTVEAMIKLFHNVQPIKSKLSVALKLLRY